MSNPKENPVVTETAAGATTTRYANLCVWLPVAIQLFTAVRFATAYLRSGMSQPAYFGKLMQMEFIAIHSGLFLGVLILCRPERAFWCGMRWVATSMYVLMLADVRH